MNIQEIKKLLEMFDASNSVKLKITNEGFEISLEKTAAKNPKVASNGAISMIPQPSISSVAQNIDSIPSGESTSASSESTASSSLKATTKNTETITSPMVGTFYRAPSPDSAPYVNVGDKVKKGQTIAIIEAMKIMNEIEAEFDCKIVEIVPNDAQSVEFDAVLFVVEKL